MVLIWSIIIELTKLRLPSSYYLLSAAHPVSSVSLKTSLLFFQNPVLLQVAVQLVMDNGLKHLCYFLTFLLLFIYWLTQCYVMFLLWVFFVFVSCLFDGSSFLLTWCLSPVQCSLKSLTNERPLKHLSPKRPP